VLLAQTVLADTFDWTSLGVNIPVRNQGKSQNCWAIGATEALEANWQIRKGSKVQLSPQPILDRLQQNGPYFVEKAMADLVQNGTALEQNYPYTRIAGPFKNVATPYRGLTWSFVASNGSRPS